MRGRWIPAATSAVVIAAVTVLTVTVIRARAHDSDPQVTSGMSRVQLGSFTLGPTSAVPARPGSRLQVGVPSPYRLFIHCGPSLINIDGEVWRPVQPVPSYPGPRASGGVTAYTGYVAGTLTRVDANTVLFTADPEAVLGNYAVRYGPASNDPVLSICA
jgi:hypothetical protein